MSDILIPLEDSVHEQLKRKALCAGLPMRDYCAALLKAAVSR